MPVILATSEIERARIQFNNSPGKKLANPTKPIKSWVWWHASVIPDMWEVPQSRPVGHKCKTLFKNYLKHKELVLWPKWYSSCLANMRP
jgi:hypothetical protein